MWSSVRVILALLFLTLPACGFSPLYGGGQDEAVKADLGRIYIENIPERPGQYLRNALIDRFYIDGRPASPAYTLTVEPIQERTTDLDITKSSDATRAQLRLNTAITLRDRATGQKLLQRHITSITSYNILQSHFTTRVSQGNTRQNALDDIARQIETQLSLYFSRNRGTVR